jgi:hypothetical protein
VSYREEKSGEVHLWMSREDYDWLMIILGSSAANFGVNRITQLADRLNEGNPNYMPHTVER